MENGTMALGNENMKHEMMILMMVMVTNQEGAGEIEKVTEG